MQYRKLRSQVLAYLFIRFPDDLPWCDITIASSHHCIPAFIALSHHSPIIVSPLHRIAITFRKSSDPPMWYCYCIATVLLLCFTANLPSLPQIFTLPQFFVLPQFPCFTVNPCFIASLRFYCKSLLYRISCSYISQSHIAIIQASVPHLPQCDRRCDISITCRKVFHNILSQGHPRCDIVIA